MKLRNKKTGEIVDDVQYRNYSFADGFGLRTAEKDYNYKTLAKFVEEWEDYITPEPLIKDEKIRKAVRAWAEANDFKNLKVSEDFKEYWGRYGLMMEFEHEGRGGDYNTYTIAELCGDDDD